MRHRLLLLNILLAGGAGTGFWYLRQEWLRDRQHASAVVNLRVKPAPAPVTAPVPAPVPFVAPTFADVAQKDLFSKDRNPNVIIEPVAVKPKPKWPRMPILTGIMGLPGGLVAMLSERPDARSRGVSVGEKIGDLKIVAMAPDKITFEFEGEQQEKSVNELLDRGVHAEVADASTSQNPANLAAQRSGPPPPPKPGIDVGSNMKSCVPGDTSPAGTVVDGFRKIVNKTPFGDACSWISQ